MSGARYCFTFCFVKSNICAYFAIAWAFRLGKSYNTERKPCRIITARARSDCVVNKFSISLVCGLRAQAADTITFCFCLWELFTFFVKRAPGANHFRSRYHSLSRSRLFLTFRMQTQAGSIDQYSNFARVLF